MKPAAYNTSPGNPKTILIADQQILMRSALACLIETRSDTYRVIKECASTDCVLEQAKMLKPDIIIVGLHLADKSGLEAIRSITESKREAHILVLGNHHDEATVRMVLASGAAAYLPCDSEPDELFQALDALQKDSHYLPRHLDRLLQESELSLSAQIECDYDPLGDLSKREREVFYLLANGKPNRMIAKQLYISPRTVETHRARVIKKLGFESTADLIKYAIRNNLLPCN